MDRSTFLKNIYKTSHCWFYIGLLNNRGYGKVGNSTAHRLSYKLHIGRIPNGRFICHKCDVPNCVNPKHLFLGTHSDNMKDRQAKGRANYKIDEIHSKKTHCPSGHPYSGDNLYVSKSRGFINRFCKICKRDSQRRIRARGNG